MVFQRHSPQRFVEGAWPHAAKVFSATRRVKLSRFNLFAPNAITITASALGLERILGHYLGKSFGKSGSHVVPLQVRRQRVLGVRLGRLPSCYRGRFPFANVCNSAHYERHTPLLRIRRS
eukprot:8776684-Pyramimonas_sp.AAC.1